MSATFQHHHKWRARISNKIIRNTTNSEITQSNIGRQLKIRTSCCGRICERGASATVRSDIILQYGTIRSPVEHQCSWLGISKVDVVRRWIKVCCCSDYAVNPMCCMCVYIILHYIPDTTFSTDSPIVLAPSLEFRTHCTDLLLKLSLIVTFSCDV